MKFMVPWMIGLIPWLTRGSETAAHSDQDVKVELGTEVSHGRDMEVTVRWLYLSASGWHMHKDSIQGLCL